MTTGSGKGPRPERSRRSPSAADGARLLEDALDLDAQGEEGGRDLRIGPEERLVEEAELLGLERLGLEGARRGDARLVDGQGHGHEVLAAADRARLGDRDRARLL